MFSGTVDRVSHEGGLLVSYTGSCPALGSVMVSSDNEYVGKVDGVIGNTESSLVHIAHLDRKSKPESFLGINVQIRTKKPAQNKGFDNRRGNDRNRDQGRGGDRNRDRGRGGDRNRDQGRGGDRSRDQGRGRDRNSSRQETNNRDWECKSCGNSNFSFRTECNRCSAPKNSRDSSNRQQSREKTPRENVTKRAGDWDCAGCGKSNFAKRSECFNCGKSKRVGGPKQRGHYRKNRDPPPIHSAKYGRRKRDEN